MMDQILEKGLVHVEARSVFLKMELNYESMVWKQVGLNLRYDLVLKE